MSFLHALLPVLAGEAHKHPTWADFGPVEWVAIVVAQGLAVWAVWKAVMYTIRPGEEEPDHIKRAIFQENDHAQPGVALQAWLVEHHGGSSAGGRSDGRTASEGTAR